MSNTELPWDQLARYLAGEGSEEEQRHIERCMEDDAEQRRLVHELQLIWDTAEEPPEGIIGVLECEADLDKLRKQIREERRKPRASDRTPQRKRASRQRVRRWRRRPAGQLLSIALLLVFVFGSGIAVLYYTSVPEQESSEPTFREVATDRGQRATIQLTDGTRVILGADSKLRIPDDFGEQTREVHLEGEAYFDVETVEDRPFITQTRHAEVVVTGTVFGVEAYQQGENMRVVVKEGSVAMRSQGQPERHAVALQAGQMGIVEGLLDQITLKYVDADAYLSWTRGELIFDDMALSDVVQRLERWYDVDIMLEDQSLAERQISATLRTRSVPDMVHVIATTLGLQYRIEEDQIALKP